MNEPPIFRPEVLTSLSASNNNISLQAFQRTAIILGLVVVTVLIAVSLFIDGLPKESPVGKQVRLQASDCPAPMVQQNCLAVSSTFALSHAPGDLIQVQSVALAPLPDPRSLTFRVVGQKEGGLIVESTGDASGIAALQRGATASLVIGKRSSSPWSILKASWGRLLEAKNLQ